LLASHRVFTVPHARKVKAGKPLPITTDMAANFQPVTADLAGKCWPVIADTARENPNK
jgi:hypothetical protein